MPSDDAEATRSDNVARIPTFSDPEKAREAGRRGAAVRAEKRKLQEQDPEAYVREKFAARRVALSEALLHAALGEGEWAELSLDKRLTALSKALEYAVGRPVARRDASEQKEEPQAGLSIE